MSKIISKIEGLREKILHPSPHIPKEHIAAVSEEKKIPVGLIAGIVIALAVVFILGRLSSNVGTTIQEQQNQISALNKKIAVMADMQFSIDKHIKKVEAATRDINNGLQTQVANINDSVKSQLDQTSANANRMEAVLQANIDDLKEKLNKLQTSMTAAASPNIGDQTNAIAVN